MEVRYLDGRAVVVPLGALPDLVTEEGNPANRRGVAKVTVRLSAPLLAKGLELVDTPGTGSVYAHNTATASDALQRMDAAIFVLSADPPISAEERAFLRQVRNRAVGLFCLLNKADHLTTDELRQAVAFTERVLVEELGHREHVWPVSARWALAASSEAGPGRTDHRWDDFTAAFTDYLAERQRSDLVRSVAIRAAGLARGVVEDASVTLAGLALSLEDLDHKMRAFTAVLDEVARSRLESAAVASAEIDRLIRETDEQANELVARATPVAQQAVANHLGALRGSLDRMEGDALEWVAAHIRGVADGWRGRRADEVVAALTALDDRLASRLDTQIAAVRDSAARLFSVDLPEWAPVGELPGATHFDEAAAAARPRRPRRCGCWRDRRRHPARRQPPRRPGGGCPGRLFRAAGVGPPPSGSSVNFRRTSGLRRRARRVSKPVRPAECESAPACGGADRARGEPPVTPRWLAQL